MIDSGKAKRDCGAQRQRNCVSQVECKLLQTVGNQQQPERRYQAMPGMQKRKKPRGSAPRGFSAFRMA
jgi:hypothetical protein